MWGGRLLREELPRGPVLVPAFTRSHTSCEEVLRVDVHEQRGPVRGFEGEKPSPKALRGYTVENRALFVAPFSWLLSFGRAKESKESKKNSNRSFYNLKRSLTLDSYRGSR